MRTFIQCVFQGDHADELLRVKGEFVAWLIDKVVVDYSKETKEVAITRVEFLLPDVI